MRITPPLYPTFIAAVMAVTGRNVWAVKLVQVILSTLTVGLVYWIGRAWFDHRRGLTAAIICTLYPTLVAFSHYLWSETLFIFLFTSSLAVLATGRRVPSRRACLLGGVLLGLSALTRSVIVYVVPVLFAWFLLVYRRCWRQSIRRIAVAAGAVIVVISPWTIRNYRVLGGFVLIDTNGPFNLWRGNSPTTFTNRPRPPQGSYQPPFQALPLMPVRDQRAYTLLPLVEERLGTAEPTDLQIMKCAKQLAWEYISSDPLAFLKRGAYKLIDMWNPTSFLLRQFRYGAYGSVNPKLESAICWSAVISYLLVMGLGLIGMLRLLRDPHAWLVVSLVLIFTLVHFTTFGLTRFRLPLMPLIMLLAAHALWPGRVLAAVRSAKRSPSSSNATQCPDHTSRITQPRRGPRSRGVCGPATAWQPLAGDGGSGPK